MSLSVKSLDCCGVVELSGISSAPYAAAPAKTVAELTKLFKGLGKDDQYGDDIDVEDEDEVRGSAGKNPNFPKEDSGFPTYLLFTEAGSATRAGTYGKALADYITRQHLGSVEATEPSKSSRTGNKVRVFTWTVAHKAINAWAKKNRALLCNCGLDHDED